jgi:hypothetical protein
MALFQLFAWLVAALPIGEYTVRCGKFPHMAESTTRVCACHFIFQYGNYYGQW